MLTFPHRIRTVKSLAWASSRYLSTTGASPAPGNVESYMWGKDNNGSIWKSSHPTPSTLVDVPAKVEPLDSKASTTPTRVFCGPTDTAVLFQDNTCYVSGLNKYGQLGLGNKQPIPSPMLLELPKGNDAAAPTITHVSLGEKFAAFVADTGDLYTCGWNGSTLSGIGNLGLGDAEERLQPTLVESLVQDECQVRQVVVGDAHMTVLTTEGEVLTVGSGAYGKLGNFDNTDQLYLDPVELLNSGVAEIAGGHSFTLALKEDGVVYGWGRNDKGQLGTGLGLSVDMYAVQTVPEPIDTDELSNRKVTKIAAGHSHAAAITESGEFFHWGMSNHLEPVRVNELVHTKIVDVCCGEDYTLALDCDGRLYSFGQGKSGTLGQGSVRHLTEATFMEIFQDRRVAQFSAGWKHAACLLEAIPQD